MSVILFLLGERAGPAESGGARTRRPRSWGTADGGRASAAPQAQGQGGQQQDADGDVLQGRWQPEDDDQGAEGAEQQRAGRRAEEGPLTALEAGPAQQRGGDRVQLAAGSDRTIDVA